MAKSDKKPAGSDEPNVTRISASDSRRSTKIRSPKNVSRTKRSKADKAEKEVGGVPGYFVGAWKELRQVRWPNRRATWGLTGAVLAFSAFFVVFIVLLDIFFKYIFELILK